MYSRWCTETTKALARLILKWKISKSWSYHYIFNANIRDLSSLTFGQTVSWKVPFQTDKKLYKDISILIHVYQIWKKYHMTFLGYFISNIKILTNHIQRNDWSVICLFWHKRLCNLVGKRIWSSWVAKSGWADFWDCWFRQALKKILAKTLANTEQ